MPLGRAPLEMEVDEVEAMVPGGTWINTTFVLWETFFNVLYVKAYEQWFFYRK